VGAKLLLFPAPGACLEVQRGAGELGLFSEISCPTQIYQVSSVQAKATGQGPWLYCKFIPLLIVQRYLQ